jgi:tetratricopeptide (TPR) repeat protein
VYPLKYAENSGGTAVAEETTVDQAPKPVQDMFNRGLGALERGNLDYAIDMFINCVDAEPTLVDVRKYLRAAEMKQYRQKKVSSVAHAMATAKSAGDILKANMALKKGQPEEALKISEKLLRRDLMNPQFIKLFCDSADALGLPDIGIQLLTMAKDFFPDDAALLTRLGALHEAKGMLSEARECYELVCSLRPNDGEALRRLKNAMAVESMTKDGWEEAAETGEGGYRSIMKDKDEAAKLEAESKAVRSSTDTESLIAETLVKIEEDPKNINFYRSLANLYATAKQYENAINALETAQEVRGGADPEIDNTLSNIKLQWYDYDIRQLEKAGDEAGAQAKAQERAEFEFSDIQDRVQRYPNDLQLRFNYAIALYENEMLNEAIQQFQFSQKNPQRRVLSMYYIGVCMKIKGQYDMATDQLEKAASEIHIMDGTKMDIFYELGLVYEAQNDPAKAREYYKEIYQVDISYKDVADRIEQTSA